MAQANTELTKKKLQEVESILAKADKQIAAALPRHMTPERMARISFSAVQRQPKLLECTPRSIAIAVINASELGLEPNLLGECYLVPYKNECVLIPGYKGLIKLARNSGQLVSIQADVVRAGDVFEFEKGLNPILRHVPSAEPEDKREITHAYAVAELQGGAKQFEVMTKAQIDAIRAKSPAGRFGPWIDHYPEMAKKTVVRRMFKYLPASPEVERAMILSDNSDAGQRQSTSEMIDLGQAEEIEQESASAPSTASKVESKLAAKKASQEPPQPISTGPTMEESAFDAEFESWPDPQQAKYMTARNAAKGEGLDAEDAHKAGYAAATSL